MLNYQRVSQLKATFFLLLGMSLVFFGLSQSQSHMGNKRDGHLIPHNFYPPKWLQFGSAVSSSFVATQWEEQQPDEAHVRPTKNTYTCLSFSGQIELLQPMAWQPCSFLSRSHRLTEPPYILRAETFAARQKASNNTDICLQCYATNIGT